MKQATNLRLVLTECQCSIDSIIHHQDSQSLFLIMRYTSDEIPGESCNADTEIPQTWLPASLYIRLVAF